MTPSPAAQHGEKDLLAFRRPYNPVQNPSSDDKRPPKTPATQCCKRDCQPDGRPTKKQEHWTRNNFEFGGVLGAAPAQKHLSSELLGFCTGGGVVTTYAEIPSARDYAPPSPHQPPNTPKQTQTTPSSSGDEGKHIRGKQHTRGYICVVLLTF